MAASYARLKVPDREGLKFGVSGTDSALVLVVELGEAGGHLSASGSGGRHHDQGTRRADIIVAAVAVVTDDQRHVFRISFNNIVAVYRDALFFEPRAEGVRKRLPAVMCQDDAPDVQAVAAVDLDQTQDVEIVGDAEVSPDLVFLNIFCIDDDQDFRLGRKLEQHLELA